MKFLSNLADFFNLSESSKEEKRQTILHTAWEEANDKFNIVRLNGIDYIKYKGNTISTKDDTVNICERLYFFRCEYVKRVMKEQHLNLKEEELCQK